MLDLDPGEGVGLAECAEVARLARAILTDMGLDPMPVTSGSKGIHLYAALDGKQTSDQVSAVAHELARALEADHPDLVVSDMKKSLRRGQGAGRLEPEQRARRPPSRRTRCAAGSQPTVAAPRTWRELAVEGPRAARLRAGDAADEATDGSARRPHGRAPGRPGAHAGAHGEFRIVRLGSRPAGALPQHARRRQDPGAGARSRRPEPIRADESFVIQEHHARRLH